MLSGFERCPVSLLREGKRVLRGGCLRHQGLAGEDEADHGLFITRSNHTFEQAAQLAAKVAE